MNKWLKGSMNLGFSLIMLLAVFVSGQHTYEVLINYTGTVWWLALAAAVAIDAAVVYLGSQTAYMAKIGDSITVIQWATWLLIGISVAINFFHGYMNGGLVGGSVAMVYPVLAALIYHFFIADKIRESLRERGRILPEKPLYAKSLDKATARKLDERWATLTGLQAADNLDYIEATTVGTWRQLPTSNGYKATQMDTAQATSLQLEPTTAYSMDTQATTERLQGYKVMDTSLQEATDVVSQLETIVDSVDFDVEVPTYLNNKMDTAEMCRLLVANGIVDNPTAYKIINKLKGDEVLKKTVQTTMKRARDKVNTSR